MIERWTSPEGIEIDAGHLAMLSRPDELAAIINGAAQHADAATRCAPSLMPSVRRIPPQIWID